MKTLVCGGRDYQDAEELFGFLDDIHSAVQITEIIHGGARGADKLAGEWAASRGIACTVFPANWQKYGKKAGTIRNLQMYKASEPDLVVAFSGGAGTANMARVARAAGCRVVCPEHSDKETNETVL